ncbi:MAG: insulinase family protein [Puniceicoccales bacterium]|nr:insulinase family protein [Puniceicoccales bacterium]
MRKSWRTFLLAMFLCLVHLEAMEALRFEWDTDIPVDEEIVSGCLKNGLHYFILPHREPPGRVSLRLIVGTGSLMETEEQRGLAHFLEHMAFCGSENFSRGDLIEQLQRMGMCFGHHTNAYTNFTETVYKLELPNNSRQSLKDGLIVFRDYLAALQIDQSEVDRERGVILSELLHLDSPQYRDFLASYEFFFPDAIIGDRHPIGLEEAIAEADATILREFYETFYRPSNAAVVIVGEVDPQMVIRVLNLIFGDISEGKTPEHYDIGTFNIKGMRVGLHREEELPQAWVHVTCARPLEEYEDSQINRAEILFHQVANRALTRRLEALSKQENAIFFQGEAHSELFFRNGVLMAGLRLSCDPQNVRETVQVAEQELRRVLEYGFTEGEIARARKDISAAYRNARVQADSVRSEHLADWTVSVICDAFVPNSVEWADDFAQKTLEEATPQRVWESFYYLWSPKNRSIYVSGNIQGKINEAVIRSAYTRSQRTALPPPEEEIFQQFAYKKFGKVGIVVEDNVDEELQIHQFTFANGVRLNVKRTDFEAQQVLVRVRFGHGVMSEPESRPGLSSFANWAFIEGGLGAHSAEEWRDLFAGHVLGVQFHVGTGAFFLSGKTTTEDLPLQLQLLTAYLADAGFRPEGEREARKMIAQVYAELEHTTEGAMILEGERFLHGGDRRFGLPEKSVMETYSMGDLRRWLQPQLGTSYVEISVVGDVDPTQVCRFVAETFGAIPGRTGQPLELDGQVALPLGQSANFSYDSSIAKGLVQLHWPTDDRWNMERTRRLNLLSDIFNERLRVRVRKEMGDTYAPYAYHVASYALKNYGYICAGALVDVGRVNDIAFTAKDIARELRAGEITEDEFQRVKLPALNQLQEQVRKNSYWLNGIDGMQAYPKELDFLRTAIPFYENVRREDLNEVLNFLDETRCITIKVRPSEP